MNHCLWCHAEMDHEHTWQNLFIPNKKSAVCHICLKQLEVIEEEVCHYCCRPSVDDECPDCKQWKWLYSGQDPLEQNISVFRYNECMKEIITKWKYRGDYQLGHIFQTVFSKVFTDKMKHEHDVFEIIPIPLSKEREYDRAFNQAEMLAGFLKKEPNLALTRIQGEKQSKKSRKERMTSKNPFNLLETINNPVVLVDDIYTTGRTIRHAAELLKANGCPVVYAFTLIRG